MKTITAGPAEPLDGIICFHLAEQKNNNDQPFAFLATYALRTETSQLLSHIPLGRALQETTAGDRKLFLLKLLLPIQKAAQKSQFLSELIQTGAIFQSTAWTSAQAYSFLKDIPFFEEAGITVRIPNWWNAKKPSQPTVTVKIGNEPVALAGLDSLLDFNIQVAFPDGSELSPEELQTVLASQDNLIRVRGQWLEVNATKLNQVLDHWKTLSKSGITLIEGLRLFAGIHDEPTSELSEDVISWSKIVEGEHLQETLKHLRHAEQLGNKNIENILAERLHAQLRPYQSQGVSWLWMLYSMRLGGCLADDMGLGKTIQILSLLLLVQKEYPTNKHLLIVPASLLGNWLAEIKKFAPGLRVIVLHRSETDLNLQKAPDLSCIDLVITTYGLVSKLDFLQSISWDLIIIDEAQTIKNPNSKQTKVVKRLGGRVKFALTGTPIENSLLDLWSLFHFVAPGLLGTSKKFAATINTDNKEQQQKVHAAIKRLVSPYILRRVKNDKRVIDDLPDKTELKAYCTLTIHQATLYQKSVEELSAILEKQDIDGIQRRGLVLSYLMRLKQICNHPNQWLGHNQYSQDASGKFIRLKELCTLIAQKEEKVLVFTQFREIVPTLSSFLATIFGRPGLEIHGQTPIKQRAALVAEFQKEDGPPFFVLSLKAGGTGLNLTKASHVIHFDRWWNPAVENQATDRAYRIGQKKNVLVHKFICSGTIEEKIDEIITKKYSLVDAMINSEAEVTLSELNDSELLDVISLDLNRALGDTDHKKD